MQDNHQQVKMNVLSQFLNIIKIKAQPLRLLVVGFKFCKKLDITITTAMNENTQSSNKSTVNKK